MVRPIFLLLVLSLVFFPFVTAAINQQVLSLPLSQVAASWSNRTALDDDGDGFFDKVIVKKTDQSTLLVLSGTNAQIFNIDTTGGRVLIGTGFEGTGLTMYTNGNLSMGGNLRVGGTLILGGTITFNDLTPNRLVATDANKNLVSTITAANLQSSVTGTTGSGNLVFATSPTVTSLTVSSGGITV
ncbi:MAG: hypothetical protein QW594_03550, partial [Candidatus Woesearchaeota archaeon]